jgi:hypothetical protein
MAVDLQTASEAERVTVRPTQNVRGGIEIFAAHSSHRKPERGDPKKDKGAWIFLKDEEFVGGQDDE